MFFAETRTRCKRAELRVLCRLDPKNAIHSQPDIVQLLQKAQ